MAQVPMTDAVSGEPASAAHNNAIIDNVQDHEARLVPVEVRTTDTVTNGGHGNVQLSTRLGTGVTTASTATAQFSTLTTRTTDTTTNGGHGNVQLSTRLGTGVTAASTATQQFATVNTRLTDAEADIAALQSGGSVDLAGRVIARGLRATSKTITSGAAEVGVLRVDSVATKGTRLYKVSAACNFHEPGSGTVTGSLTLRIRYNTSGVATTSSTLLASCFGLREVGGFVMLTAPFVLPADQTVSFLMTASASTANMEVVGNEDSSSRFITLDVQDAGVDPGDTGVDI